MSAKFIVEKFLFLITIILSLILGFHALITKILREQFFISYLTASCGSGAILLTLLFIIARFNKNLEIQISNFLYFRGKRHYNTLLKEAITDGLTDLYDHRYFQLRLEDEIARAKRYVKPLSLLMIDLDNFKKYNDTFGHPEGDKVLIKIGECFKRLARKVDIPARYGGEEFVVILPETKKEGAKILAERLRSHVEGVTFKDGHRITISIGIGWFDGSAEDFTKADLLKMADEALYRAKSQGRNRVEA